MMSGRATMIMFAALVGIVAVCFSWQGGLASLYDDSESYLVMAQALSPWQSPSPSVLAAYASEPYPPLFPLLLAICGGGQDWHVAHALVAVSFAASVFLLGVLARDIARSWLVAAAVVLVFAWMPGMWLNMKGILSEFPFTALTIAAVLQYRAWQHRPDVAPTMMLGFLLAAAVLTRSIGVALLGAILLVEAGVYLRQRDRRRLVNAALALTVAVAAAGLWHAMRPHAVDDPYRTAWTARLVLANLSAFLDAWLTALLVFWYEPLRLTFIVACGIGACGLIGSLWRSAQGEADAVYVLLFLGLLAAWPYPGQMYRLVLPVLPFLLMNAFWLWQRLLAFRFDPERRDRLCIYASALPLGLCIPATVLHVGARAHEPCEELVAHHCETDIAEFYRAPSLATAKADARREIGVLADLERIRRTTPEQARVAWYVSDYVALLAGRTGVELRNVASAEILTARLKAQRPDYVYLTSVHPRDSAHRDGDPLSALATVLRYGDIEWRRDDTHGTLESVLVRIDRQRLPP
jgi:hypothetical protein